MKLFIIFYVIMAILSTLLYYVAIWFAKKMLGVEKHNYVFKAGKPIANILIFILANVFWPLHLLWDMISNTIIVYLRLAQSQGTSEYYRAKGKQALEDYFHNIMHL